MSLLVEQCLQKVHLIKQKINLIITEEKIVLKQMCKKLKEHTMKIINYEEKEMIPLTDEENKSYEEREVCHICIETFCVDMKMMKIIKIEKRLKITVITQENLEELLIAFGI